MWGVFLAALLTVMMAGSERLCWCQDGFTTTRLSMASTDSCPRDSNDAPAWVNVPTERKHSVPIEPHSLVNVCPRAKCHTANLREWWMFRWAGLYLWHQTVWLSHMAFSRLSTGVSVCVPQISDPPQYHWLTGVWHYNHHYQMLNREHTMIFSRQR